MKPADTAHIFLDEQGRGWIDDTNTKVIEVVLDRLSGMSPEQIREGYPYLSLAQIHAALSFYYDHQAELEIEIMRQLKEVDAYADAAKDSPGRQRLRERGLRPTAATGHSRLPRPVSAVPMLYPRRGDTRRVATADRQWPERRRFTLFLRSPCGSA